MTPEGRAIWKSPGGVSLLTAWLENTPLTPEALAALAAMKALNEKNGIRPLPRSSGPMTGVQLGLDFSGEDEGDGGSGDGPKQTANPDTSETLYPTSEEIIEIRTMNSAPPRPGTSTWTEPVPYVVAPRAEPRR